MPGRAAALLVVLLAACSTPGTTAPRPPNIVLILADDLGHGDLGSYGATDLRTPHLDRLAREGLRFTDFVVSQSVCTASRAALLTGCYANRVGLQGALNHQSRAGIHPDERLLPELLRDRGYATAIFGKWHLGHLPMFNPLRHGFDEFLGLPYSNDNGPAHPTMPGLPPLPLLDGDRVAETDPDQARFTRRFTDRALDFMRRNAARPFFLYLPHVMPHVPIHASPSFRGRSARGLYGDVVEELDSSVGELLAELARLDLDRDTIVIFLSDNGPFLSYGTHAGSAGPLREGKLTAYEGGLRVPCLVRWPGRLPAGVLRRGPAAAMDLLPTLARIAGAPLPERRIDGADLGADFSGSREVFYAYAGEELHAVRAGRWKLHVAHDYLTPDAPLRTDGKPANWGNLKPAGMDVSGIRGIASRHGYRVARQEQALYDLEADPGERVDVASAHPDVVARLGALLESARADLGDALAKRSGAGVRPAGRAP
jgi:arylsulfatase